MCHALLTCNCMLQTSENPHESLEAAVSSVILCVPHVRLHCLITHAYMYI